MGLYMGLCMSVDFHTLFANNMGVADTIKASRAADNYFTVLGIPPPKF